MLSTIHCGTTRILHEIATYQLATSLFSITARQSWRLNPDTCDMPVAFGNGDTTRYIRYPTHVTMTLAAGEHLLSMRYPRRC
jgi:hypothetical protein